VESKSTSTVYHSYLLRLWSVDGAQTWRVMVEHVGTHERHGFADLESFFDFLRREAAGEKAVGCSEEKPRSTRV